jgi:signal transduction histidine kinase
MDANGLARGVLDRLDAQIIVVDAQTSRILYSNGSESGMYSAGVVAGAMCHEAHGGSGVTHCPICPVKSLRDEPDGRVTWVFQNPDTRRFYKNISRMIPWEGGAQAVLTQSFDISEEMRAAELHDKAKNDFLSRMSHEIRTPINAIMGLSRMAAGATSRANAQGYLARIDVAAKQLMEIVNDILSFSTLESGDVEIFQAPVTLTALLEDACSAHMPAIREKGQYFGIFVGQGVPQRFVADKAHLGQVISHLVSNAAKFTGRNGIIRVRALIEVGGEGAARSGGRDGAGQDGAGKGLDGAGKGQDGVGAGAGKSQDGAVLEVSVSDTGIGISAEQQQNLFNVFEQANGTKSRNYGGIGLGLSIVKRLTDLMGGQIRVQSEENKGSVFTVRVPVKVLPEVCEDDGAAPAGAKGGAGGKSPDGCEGGEGPNGASGGLRAGSGEAEGRDGAGGAGGEADDGWAEGPAGMGGAGGSTGAVAAGPAGPAGPARAESDDGWAEGPAGMSGAGGAGGPIEADPMRKLHGNPDGAGGKYEGAAGSWGPLGECPARPGSLGGGLDQGGASAGGAWPPGLEPQTPPLFAPEGQGGRGGEAAYDAFLPHLDVAGALARIRGNKKLYAMMLRDFRRSGQCEALLSMAAAGPREAVVEDARRLSSVAESLAMPALKEAIEQLEAVAQRGLSPGEALGRLRVSVAETLGKVDALIGPAQ